MNLRAELSLTLNALLLGFVVWLGSAGSRSETLTEASRFLTNRGLRVKPQPRPSPPAVESLPEVANEPFSWAQLESSDYRVYLANLRAIGCPEPTVRDIIIADVNDLFAARVKALVDEVTGRFWQLIIRKDDLEKMVDEKHTQLQALMGERDGIFTALFGDHDPRSAEGAERYAADRREEWEGTADFLPEEKRVRFVAARENLEREWAEYLRTPGLTDAERQAKRKELDAAHDQSLGEWLSPDEYDELRLRQSPAASLRDRLVGLDLNEDALHAVAKIQFAQSPQKAEAQTRELLGADGYAAFQRATDSRYEPIYRVTQRLELPDATAAQAYDIRRQAEDVARQLSENKALSAEDRQAMLQAVSAETRQSLSVTLGPKGFAAYEKIDGGWMQQMSGPRP